MDMVKSMENKAKKTKLAPIDILDILHYCGKKWFWICLSTVFFAGVLLVYTLLNTEMMYKSTSMLFVAKVGTITSISDVQIGSYLAEDYVVIATSKPVIDTAIQKLKEDSGVELTRSQAIAAISVKEIDDTHILQFSVTYDDPQIACDLCDAITDAMADQIAYIMSTDSPTIVERPEVCNSPINSTEIFSKTLMGACIGLVLSVLVLLYIYLLDGRIRDEVDIEAHFNVPVLVSLPYEKNIERSNNKKKKH